MAGADIAEMQNLAAPEAFKFMEFGHDTLRLIETMPKPSIAAVNGFALGGGTEISLACDIRFAAENAVFGQPEILIGLIPGWGGTQRLPRLVGAGIAKELILGGGQINAQRAYEIGLVNRVFPAASLMEETKKFARKLASMPAFAVKMAKYSINYGYDLALDNANKLEIECCRAVLQHAGSERRHEGFSGKKKTDVYGEISKDQGSPPVFRPRENLFLRLPDIIPVRASRQPDKRDHITYQNCCDYFLCQGYGLFLFFGSGLFLFYFFSHVLYLKQYLEKLFFAIYTEKSIIVNFLI